METQLVGSRTKKRLPPAEPGYEGRRELQDGKADNPYAFGEQESVVRNIRESSLTTMHARRQIDEAQLRAGERFRSLYERASVCGSMAIDPSKEPVDGGGNTDPIPDRVVQASKELGVVRAELGRIGNDLVTRVCGHGSTVEQVARVMFAAANERDVRFIGQMLREQLDMLAVMWGYAASKRAWQEKPG